MPTRRKSEGKARNGGNLAEFHPFEKRFFQILHLPLAARTGATALAFVGAFGNIELNVVLLGNLPADTLQISANLLSS